MEYELVYDAANDFVGWQIIVGWLLLFAFFLAMICKTDRIPRFIYWFMRIDETDTAWGRTIIAVALLLLGAISFAMIKENFELQSISKKNECTQIEGVVTDYKGEATVGENPEIRLREESFALDELKFEYDTHFMVFGFNKAAADGGPIYEGAKVRLCYVERIENRKKERKIIRVEEAIKPIG